MLHLLPLSLLPLVLSTHTPPHTNQLRHRALASRQTTGSLDSNAPAGGFQVVGDSGVSAQMMFLGTEETVYILDKSENNSLQISNHPAWGTTFSLSTYQSTPVSVSSNTFCAGGFPLANGTWAVFGGNQPVTYAGVAVNDKGANPTGGDPYNDGDGGAAIRLLDPCDGGDGECPWQEGLTMTGKRWYPTIEGLSDGSVIVLGGDTNGGYVSTFVQNNPSFEYFPARSSAATSMSFLNETVPVNLFPLTWLLPNGQLFLQAAYKTILYDLDTETETPLPDMPYAQRVYPASAAAAMLPLTPANNYSATILFCGGSNADLSKSSDGGAGFNVTAVVADQTCVRISPEDTDPSYEDDDFLFEPRSMGSFVYLPDGTLWLGNGVGMGTAGYGDEKWSVGQSYGQAPVYVPAIYNPSAPAGSRFSRTNLTPSPHERMYHSTAILLPDGAILVSGSNPNKDVTFTQWGTSYVVEKWYPTWYNSPRPTINGTWPTSLGYGGAAWDLSYTPANSASDVDNTKVVVIRTGFSTHCMNFGQRYLELATSYTKNSETGQVTMHVSQMPPNPNVFVPGPAMIYLVVDGVPSIGKMITIGSGQIGTQPILAAATLPQSSVIVPSSTSSSNSSSSGNSTASGNDTASGTDSSSTAGVTKISTVKNMAPAGLVPGFIGVGLVGVGMGIMMML